MDTARLLAAIADHKLTVLAGAGISMAAPSSLPSWLALNTAFLEGLWVTAAVHLDDDGPDILDFLVTRREETGAFPPDLQAQLVEEELGEKYFEVLQVLDTEAFNANHAALAVMCAAGSVRAIVTTNFDRLIEIALRAARVPHRVFATVLDFEALPAAIARSDPEVLVIKVHGTVEDTRSMVDTLRQRVLGRPEVLDSSLQSLFAQHATLVVGFSGVDLMHDPQYLGLRAGMARGPCCAVVKQPDRDLHPAMAALIGELGPRAEVLSCEAQALLSKLAATVGPGIAFPEPAYDMELEHPGVRAAMLPSRTCQWAEGVGALRVTNILAVLTEAAGSADLAFDLLKRATPKHKAAGHRQDAEFGRHLTLLGRLVLERGRVFPEGGIKTSDWHDGVFYRDGNSALELLSMAHAQGMRPDTLGALGLAHAYAGEFELARRVLRMVRFEYHDRYPAATRCEALLQAADGWEVCGDMTTARETLDEAARVARANGDPLRELHALAGLTRHGDDSLDLDATEQQLWDGLQRAKALGRSRTCLRLTEGLALVQLRRGNDQAGHHLLARVCNEYQRTLQFSSLVMPLLLYWDCCHRLADQAEWERTQADLGPLVERVPGLTPRLWFHQGLMACRSKQNDAAARTAQALRRIGDQLSFPWAARRADDLEGLLARNASAR